MSADRAVDRAVIKTGAAADAAEHGSEVAAEHLAPSVVEQDDMVLARAVRVAGSGWAGGKGGVGGDLLASARAGKQPEHGAGVLEGRHELLDRGEDDMHLWQGCGEVSVPLIGNDHRRSGLGDEQVRS